MLETTGSTGDGAAEMGVVADIGTVKCIRANNVRRVSLRDSLGARLEANTGKMTICGSYSHDSNNFERKLHCGGQSMLRAKRARGAVVLSLVAATQGGMRDALS